MIIRNAQLEAFRVAGIRQFESEMAEHLAVFAPELAAVAGTAGLQAAAHLGVERATRYGFTNRGPIRLYLELLCSFGSDFDTDPQYPWAPAILNDSTEAGQTRRASRLYRAAIAYFQEVAGPNDRYARLALAKALGIEWPEISSAAVPIERVVAGFKLCYPQKYAYVGESSLLVLARRAFHLAELHGLQSDRNRALLAAVLFGFGHGALSDPLYPWISGALSDPLLQDSDSHAGRLQDRVRTYISRILRSEPGESLD